MNRLFILVFLLTCSTIHSWAYRDLETGTFITRDLAGMIDGPNQYSYVRQNPWTSFDPKGLQAMTPEVAKFLSENGSDDYVQARQQGQQQFIKDVATLKATTDAVAGLNPVQNAITAVTGKTATGDEESGIGRTASVVGVVGGSLAKLAGKVFGQVADLFKLGIKVNQVGDSAQVTRYMSEAEANLASKTGEIPNMGIDQKLRPTHVTTDVPLDSASEAAKKYEINTPTHRATVPADRVKELGPTPDGRATTSGGGSQAATSNPIPVRPEEIKKLKE